MVTLSDVARRAGVSPMTASRVFNGLNTVSETSRGRVLAAAAELGYVPNAVARSLKSARSNLVALVVSDIGNPFFAQIAKHAERALSAAGYRVVIASSDEDAEIEAGLLGGLAQMRVEGMIIVPTPHNGRVLDGMVVSGTPVVQLDRTVEGVRAPAVLLDNLGAARDAVRHLAASGYRNAVMLSGPQSLTTGAERARGAEQGAAEHHGLTLRVVEAQSFMHEQAVDVVRQALALHPDSIIAGNNVVLEACMDAFAREGINAPEDVALIGFDDFPWMGWVQPSITTVRQPVEAMADAAVTALLHRIGGTKPARDSASTDESSTQRFPATVIPRDSTRPREQLVRRR